MHVPLSYAADESFCCVSSTPDIACSMTAPERDFFKYFTDNGVSEGYVSESGYYSGPVRNFTMHLTDPAPSNFYFWFVALTRAGTRTHAHTMTPMSSVCVSYNNRGFLLVKPLSLCNAALRHCRTLRYYTDLDGFPVEQGEGGCVMPRGCPGVQVDVPTSREFNSLTVVSASTSFSCGCITCNNNGRAQGPKYLFHQYDRASFAPPSQPFDAATFEVPAVCRNATSYCEVTPPNLCAGGAPPPLAPSH